MANVERYYVEGPNGQRFGPATIEEIRSWLAEGRVSTWTGTIRESDGDHITVGELLGLEASPSAPPVYGQPGVAPVPKKSNTLVIVLIVFLVIFLFCGVIGAAILLPVFAQAKRAAIKTQQLSNMKQMSLGLIMYASDNDDKLPLDMTSASTFHDPIMPYMKNEEVFKYLNPSGGEILGNKQLSKKNTALLDDPAQTIMIYDSAPWDGKAMTGFADGHVLVRQPMTWLEAELAKPVKFHKP